MIFMKKIKETMKIYIGLEILHLVSQILKRILTVSTKDFCHSNEFTF